MRFHATGYSDGAIAEVGSSVGAALSSGHTPPNRRSRRRSCRGHQNGRCGSRHSRASEERSHDFSHGVLRGYRLTEQDHVGFEGASFKPCEGLYYALASFAGWALTRCKPPRCVSRSSSESGQQEGATRAGRPAAPRGPHQRSPRAGGSPDVRCRRGPAFTVPGSPRSDGSGLGACQLDDPGQRSRAPSASYVWASQVTALPRPDLSRGTPPPPENPYRRKQPALPAAPSDAGTRTVRPAHTRAGTLSRRITPGRRLPMLPKGLVQRRRAPDDGRRRTTAFRVRCLGGGVLFAAFRHQGGTAHNRATLVTRSVMAALHGQHPGVQQVFALRLQRARPTSCARPHRLQVGRRLPRPGVRERRLVAHGQQLDRAKFTSR